MKKILFIINPKSGTDRIKALQKDIDLYLDDKFDAEIIYTEYAKHGTNIARKAVKNRVDIVVVVGGDGSVNDVVNGLYGSDVIMGIIPKGSGNGLARSLKISLKETAAIQKLNDLNVKKINVGSANHRLFVSNAGVGFDAVITNQFTKSTQRGFLSYIGLILKNIFTYKPKKWQFKINGKTKQETAFMLTAANAVQLGYGFQIAPEAKLDDGLLDVVTIRKFPILLGGKLTLGAFTGKILKSKYVEAEKTKEIEVYHPNLQLMQVDGEAMTCDSTVKIKIMPKQLRVLV